MATRIQLRGDLAANWTSVNPILAEREFALETDTNKYKIGDGVTHWTGLTYPSFGVTLSGGTDITITNDYEISFTGSIPTTSPYDLVVAASNESTAITTGAAKITFYAPSDFTLTEVIATLTTAGSTSSVIDFNYNGASVMAGPITLASGIYYNASATTTTAISKYGRFTVDVDTAGTGAAGLKVMLVGYKSL